MSIDVLRSTAERMAFCDSYFSATGAKLVRQGDGYREVELPRSVDKDLTDRPYYWLWAEQTEQDVPATVLRLAFTEAAQARENDRLRTEAFNEQRPDQMSEIERMFFRPPTAELIELGSFRLDRILKSVQKRGRFASVGLPNTHGVLVPWLMVNAVVSYRCDLAEQSWHSVGVCLENGQLTHNFFGAVHHLALQATAPSDLLAQARITVEQAAERATAKLLSRALLHPDEWAKAARDRLAKEELQLKTYYASILPDLSESEQTVINEELSAKLRQLRERMEPRIEIEVTQAALIGLLRRSLHA